MNLAVTNADVAEAVVPHVNWRSATRPLPPVRLQLDFDDLLIVCRRRVPDVRTNGPTTIDEDPERWDGLS